MKIIILLCNILFSTVVLAQALYTESFISPPGSFPANHGSSIVDLPNGDILSCWYAGTQEKARDTQIQCARKNSQSNAWESPQVAVAQGEKKPGTPFKYKSLGNAALYLDSENILWLFYTPIMFFNGWSAAHVDYKTSNDFGKTWGKAKTLKGFFGNLTKNKPIKIDDNHFMVPLYKELFSHTGFTCVIKHKAGKLLSKKCKRIQGSNQIQPSLVKFKDDQMFAYMRMYKNKNIAFGKYNFKNKRWGKTESTNLPNPNAGVDAIKYDENTILIVYNDSFTNRETMSLAYSNDGKNFTKIWDFETGLDCSYPAIIKASDGTVHVSYTYNFRDAIKHISFNNDWLQAAINNH